MKFNAGSLLWAELEGELISVTSDRPPVGWAVQNDNFQNRFVPILSIYTEQTFIVFAIWCLIHRIEFRTKNIEGAQLTALRIPNRTARHLWLAAQGLGTAPTGALDVLSLIRDLGFVQLDTIQVVSRAHHHILWSRNQNYREPMLNQLLARDRAIFEHFTHDASVIPMEFLPMWQRQFRRKKAQIDQANWYKNMPEQEGRAAIKSRIRAEGALSTHAFDSDRKGPKEMWSRPPHKLALDYMWYSGELATCHRVNFTKYYNLPERVFPAHYRDTAISDADQITWLCQAAVDRMGFCTLGEVQKFWDAVDTGEVRNWANEASDGLCSVEVETAQGQWIASIAPADIEQKLAELRRPTSRLRILNPFDPVIRDRVRFKRLFGFDYRVEMFVPAAKRVWGYYVYPILESDRFVGRIEIKADRQKSTLSVLNFWPEGRIKWSTTRYEKLNSELARMARFISVREVVWEDLDSTQSHQ